MRKIYTLNAKKIEILGKRCNIIQLHSKYQIGADIYEFSNKMLVQTMFLSEVSFVDDKVIFTLGLEKAYNFSKINNIIVKSCKTYVKVNALPYDKFQIGLNNNYLMQTKYYIRWQCFKSRNLRFINSILHWIQSLSLSEIH